MNSESGENQRNSDHGRESNRLSSNHQMKNLAWGGRLVDYTELKYRAPGNLVATKLAKSLGIFSIALGAAEVFAPGAIGRLIGVNSKYRKFLPLLGAREIAHGVGIMSQTKPTESVWSRVAGDGVDLAFLTAARQDEQNNRQRLTCATTAVLGVVAVDILCAFMLSSQDWNATKINARTPTTLGQTSGRQAR